MRHAYKPTSLSTFQHLRPIQIKLLAALQNVLRKTMRKNMRCAREVGTHMTVSITEPGPSKVFVLE